MESRIDSTQRAVLGDVNPDADSAIGEKAKFIQASQAFDTSMFSHSLESLGLVFDEFKRSYSIWLTPVVHKVAASAIRVFARRAPRASVLRKQPPGDALASTDVVAGDESQLSPLALACQVIGRHMGIRFVAHVACSGSNQRDLLSIAVASKIKFRKVYLRTGWWKENGGPILAFRSETRSPVALLPDGERYRMYDPLLKTSQKLDQESAAGLDKDAYVFYRPLPATISDLWSFTRFGLFGCGHDFLVMISSGVAGALLGLAPAIASRVFIDQLLPAGRRTELVQSAILLLACVFSMAMLSLTRSFAILRLEGRIDANLQTGIWDRLIGLPVAFFRWYSSGDLAARSLGISEIRKNMADSVASSLLSSLFSVFSLVLLFWFDWRLALFANLLVISAIVIGLAGGALQLYFERQLAQIRGHIAGFRVQLLNGISKLRITGAERRAFALWSREYRSQTAIAIRAGRVSSLVATFTAIFPLACFGCMFYLAGRDMSSRRQLTVGTFVAFMAAFGQFLSAATQLSGSAISLMRIIPLCERIEPILRNLTENHVARKQPETLSGAIQFQDVSFRYKRESFPVLSNISLRISPGEFVALVGPSGCGKSTCLRLLLGFEKPESGVIRYDGQNLEELDIELVRRQIGVVLQNGRVMAGSILENIVGSSLFSVNDAWDAACLAALDKDIAAMPMGIHTVVGEGGFLLSAGQRQRLMIARAIIRRPKILLLDEATSALDNQTQSIIVRNLEQLKVTRIMIAQRLSTIVNAEIVYVMEKGRIVQEGPYQALLREKGLFQELAQSQLI
jgi:NHLM bacteriocin system ABC transporter ATP-binding protein